MARQAASRMRCLRFAAGSVMMGEPFD
jgi:hypothetical protein